jgi:hypothetical protein
MSKDFIDGKILMHNYEVDMDGPCYEYCVGCKACSCFPQKYAAKAYKKIRRLTTYYCFECFEAKKSTCDYDDNNIYDTEVINDFSKINEILQTQCYGCGKDIIQQNANILHKYINIFICNNCARYYGEKEFVRVSDSFRCAMCHEQYIINDKGIILCEAISN